jgi:hypothetical protein
LGIAQQKIFLFHAQLAELIVSFPDIIREDARRAKRADG